MNLTLTPAQADIITSLLGKEWARLDLTRRPLTPPEDQGYIDRQNEIEQIQQVIFQATR